MPLATYKARMQEWLQDTAFWADMNAYVSDWSQEVYADVRSYAAPGAPTASRRDALVDYLRHSDLLAVGGGGASGTANAFFANASSAGRERRLAVERLVRLDGRQHRG